MPRIRIILAIICAGFSAASYTKEYPAFNPDVSTWIESLIPEDKNSFDWHNWRFSAIHASFLWEVKIVNEKIVANMKNMPYDYSDPVPPFNIKIPSPYKGLSRAFFVADGWLFAFNEPRVGGELWWYSHNGKESYKVVEAYVTALIERDGEIYFLDAYHFNINIPLGSLQRIVKGNDGRWHLDKVVATKMYPMAMTFLSNGNLIIADSPSGLLIANKDLHVTELLDSNDVLLTYPKSIVSTSDDKYLYVGSTQYVVEVNLETKKVRYLVPSEAFIEHRIDEPNSLLFQ